MTEAATLRRCVLLCVLATGCGGGADAVPANTRGDPGALIACREFLPLAEREDKGQITNEQFSEGLRTVREKAFAANPASEVTRLSEQLLKTVSADGSGHDRRETLQQLKTACSQTVK